MKIPNKSIKKPLIIILLLLTLTFISVPSHAWLIYHKPEFKGKVIDSETKEPIEGAVVVVTYSKTVFRFMPETGDVIIEVKETLTDKDGNFSIPSYTTMIDPLAWESHADFIIFKPGYGSFPDWRVSPPQMWLHNVPPGNSRYYDWNLSFEEFFSGKVGEVKELWASELMKEDVNPPQKINLAMGIVELPKLKTREERIKAKPAPVGEPSDWKKQKQFIKAIREEWQYLTGEDPRDLYIYKK